MTTDYQTTPDIDAAMDEARQAAASPMDGFIERIAERVGGKASVRAVFGDPVERDGITVIPVAKVRWGFGGGGGTGPVAVGPGLPGEEAIGDASRTGSGSGGGGGAAADPLGYIEIGPGGATFRPIVPAMPSPAFLLASGITAALVLRAVARLIRR